MSFWANETIKCSTPDRTFDLGTRISGLIEAGDVLLLKGGLGAGKTLLTKGMLSGLGFDVDEVTSPSFTLVNLYKTDKFDVYHIDLWRLDGGQDAAAAVGLEEILEGERFVAIIEWADRLNSPRIPNRSISISIDGDGDDDRLITIYSEQLPG
ncbi:MAG: tRNA (adenosine(37)-N6)-threonylcarbamoyltransferase complex ATPase subunit type 1 TsaE [Pyrinomonadaceae bacterium]